MPYPDSEQDNGPLLNEDQVMALVNSMYAGGVPQREYQPLQTSGYTQAELYNAEDAKYYPPARDSSGNLMNPGEPNAIAPIVPPPTMASPERQRQWETLQSGVRRMSPEEMAAGSAAGVQRANIFDIAQKNAEEAGQDREFTRAFLMTTRVQDAYKVIQAAKRFQAMRQFQRDVKGGMSTIQALNQNPGMFSGDAGITRAAQLGAQAPWELKTTTTPQGYEATTWGPRLTVTRPPVERAEPRLTAEQQLKNLQDQADRLKEEIESFPDPNSPFVEAKARQRTAILDLLRRKQEEFGVGVTGNRMPTGQVIAPPPGITPAAAGQSVLRFRKDPKTGKAVQY
jgi:hypothetical protein